MRSFKKIERVKVEKKHLKIDKNIAIFKVLIVANKKSDDEINDNNNNNNNNNNNTWGLVQHKFWDCQNVL